MYVVSTSSAASNKAASSFIADTGFGMLRRQAAAVLPTSPVCIFLLFRHFRARSYKGHRTAKNIKKLTDLIQATFTNNFAHTGDPAVSSNCDLRAYFICIIDHSPKLENVELFSVLRYAHLPIKHRAFGIQLDCNSQYQKDR